LLLIFRKAQFTPTLLGIMILSPNRSSKPPQDDTPQQLPPPPPNDSRANVSHIDSSSSSNRADLDSHAASSTSTSASTICANATYAKRQACGVHERSSPCVCPLYRSHRRRRLATHSGAGAAHHPMQPQREGSIWSLYVKESSLVLMGVLPRHPCRL
jgi:hypothetical protein